MTLASHARDLGIFAYMYSRCWQELRQLVIEPVRRFNLSADVHGVRYPEGFYQLLAYCLTFLLFWIKVFVPDSGTESPGGDLDHG
jgi:hypothetical protein